MSACAGANKRSRRARRTMCILRRSGCKTWLVTALTKKSGASSIIVDLIVHIHPAVQVWSRCARCECLCPSGCEEDEQRVAWAGEAGGPEGRCERSRRVSRVCGQDADRHQHAASESDIASSWRDSGSGTLWLIVCVHSMALMRRGIYSLPRMLCRRSVASCRTRRTGYLRRSRRS